MGSGWMKIQYMYAVEYYSAPKKREVLPFATTWKNPEDITLSEASHTKTSVTSFCSWGIQNSQTHRLVALSFNYELSTIVMYCRITCIHRYKINETLETTDQHKESSFLLFLFDVSFCSQQNAVAPRAALPPRRKPGPKQLWPVSPWLPPAPQDLGQGPSY